MEPHIFLMPDGSRVTVWCLQVDAAEVAIQLGAITHAPESEAEEVLAALYGHPLCTRCSLEATQISVEVELFFANVDRPPNRLPERWG